MNQVTKLKQSERFVITVNPTVGWPRRFDGPDGFAATTAIPALLRTRYFSEISGFTGGIVFCISQRAGEIAEFKVFSVFLTHDHNLCDSYYYDSNTSSSSSSTSPSFFALHHSMEPYCFEVSRRSAEDLQNVRFADECASIPSHCRQNFILEAALCLSACALEEVM